MGNFFAEAAVWASPESSWSSPRASLSLGSFCTPRFVPPAGWRFALHSRGELPAALPRPRPSRRPFERRRKRHARFSPRASPTRWLVSGLPRTVSAFSI